MGNRDELKISFSIPDIISKEIDISDIYHNYNARGNPTSFGLDLFFAELGLTKTIKSSDFYLLQGKIEETLRSWETKYQRHLDNQHKKNRSRSVDDLNREAKDALEQLQTILHHTLSINDAVDWDQIKRKDTFQIKPEKLYEKGVVPKSFAFDASGRPTAFVKDPLPAEPSFEQIKSTHGLFSKLFQASKILQEYKNKHLQWTQDVDNTHQTNKAIEASFNAAVENYERKKASFDKKKTRDNDRLEQTRKNYQEANPNTIEEYCDLVLTQSQYPEYFPKDWVLEYRQSSRLLVVDYSLPPPALLPAIESYKYVKTRDQIVEKELSEAARKKLYDSVIYQISIRTLHELFEADVIDMLDMIAFNGLVTNTNPATGIRETKTIISVSASKEAFMQFDLSKVDPRSTFKHLKGICATSLSDLTPIAPIFMLDKSDKRFIDGRDVVQYIDPSTNLAAMKWDDFEHLVREMFEKEFASSGGEVRVTQASSDGGVDAIAFDPDPIRGGKIVIQAKRYTNTVGVSAVRDLYGTVMNEGATKGILVTTSDYGKDSFEFVKDKPITLLNGNNLLSLLEKHGHKARIDIKEARAFV